MSNFVYVLHYFYQLIDHLMAGVEDIVGKTGNYNVRDKFKRFDNKFIRPHILKNVQVSKFSTDHRGWKPNARHKRNIYYTLISLFSSSYAHSRPNQKFWKHILNWRWRMPWTSCVAIHRILAQCPAPSRWVRCFATIRPVDLAEGWLFHLLSSPLGKFQQLQCMRDKCDPFIMLLYIFVMPG